MLNKPLLLRLHRWVALTFGLPLLAVIATGLILSVEPMVAQGAVRPGSITAEALLGLLQRHDPQGAARALFVRPLERTVTLRGWSVGSIDIDLATGGPAIRGGTTLSEVFGAARGIHERLIFDAGWLVTASTVAMLVLTSLGILMGWPRLRNSLAGWHKGLGWLLLPLVVLSPLTGLMLALGITFAPTPTLPPAPPLPLLDAVRVLGADHDLSGLSWIRPLGRTLAARILEDGEMRTYAITRAGAVSSARNWPRLIHEGTWGGIVLSLLNLATAAALLGLLVTGLWIWARRKLRSTSRLGRQSREPQGALARRP
jgi:hypothetical protein